MARTKKVVEDVKKTTDVLPEINVEPKKRWRKPKNEKLEMNRNDFDDDKSIFVDEDGNDYESVSRDADAYHELFWDKDDDKKEYCSFDCLEEKERKNNNFFDKIVQYFFIWIIIVWVLFLWNVIQKQHKLLNVANGIIQWLAGEVKKAQSVNYNLMNQIEKYETDIRNIQEEYKNQKENISQSLENVVNYLSEVKAWLDTEVTTVVNNDTDTTDTTTTLTDEQYQNYLEDLNKLEQTQQ